MGNRRLVSILCLQRWGALVSNSVRSPLIRPTRLLKLSMEARIRQHAVLTRDMVDLPVTFVPTRVWAEVMALCYALLARSETVSRRLSTSRAQQAPVTLVTSRACMVR